MIRTKALTKIFEIKKGADIPAVVDLDLSIDQGEVFGFLGPNGAGKTTTVGMLTSLIGPTSGEAWVNGFKVGSEDKEIRSSVSVLTEHPGLLSAFKNLSIYANLFEVEQPEKQVEKYLHMLGLWSRRDVAGLLLMPATRHILSHLNEAKEIIKKLKKAETI